MSKKNVFENKSCGRCGGSGKYSYCQTYGTTCFGCGGSGHRLTKRGVAAQKYFSSLCSKPVGEVAVGDIIQVKDLSRWYFSKVTDISASHVYGKSLDGTDNIGITISTAHPKHGRSGLTTGLDTIIRVAHSAEAKQEKLVQALAYQDTLTQRGVVSRRKQRKE